MLNDNLEAYTLSIVLVGSFNPAIIHPSWLSNKKLIREQEAENSNIELVHPDISKFSTDWATFEITRDRFEIRTTQEPYFEPIKDLVIEIFKIIKETPINSFGINHLKYYDLRDKERHYNFGNKLAPLNNWGDYLNDPRLLNLEIIEQKRRDGLKGQYRIKIQPPDIKLSTNYGILINLNDHYLCNENDNFLELFHNSWEQTFNIANEIIQSLWNKLN